MAARCYKIFTTSKTLIARGCRLMADGRCHCADSACLPTKRGCTWRIGNAFAAESTGGVAICNSGITDRQRVDTIRNRLIADSRSIVALSIGIFTNCKRTSTVCRGKMAQRLRRSPSAAERQLRQSLRDRWLTLDRPRQLRWAGCGSRSSSDIIAADSYSIRAIRAVAPVPTAVAPFPVALEFCTAFCSVCSSR